MELIDLTTAWEISRYRDAPLKKVYQSYVVYEAVTSYFNKTAARG